MPAAAADWIAATVLGVRYVGYSGRYDPIRACPCQWGPCGSCVRGQHQHCLRRAGEPYPFAETFILDLDGYAVGPDVWTAGEPCRYRCPCPCPADEQMDLVAGGGGP